MKITNKDIIRDLKLEVKPVFMYTSYKQLIDYFVNKFEEVDGKMICYIDEDIKCELDSRFSTDFPSSLTKYIESEVAKNTKLEASFKVMPKNSTHKIYEVIFVDEWNNFDLIGWFLDLKNSVDKLNDAISLYGDGKYKLNREDLRTYAGSFNEVFDFSLGDRFVEEFGDEAYDDFQGCQVRGFIHEFTDAQVEAMKEFIDDYAIAKK